MGWVHDCNHASFNVLPCMVTTRRPTMHYFILILCFGFNDFGDDDNDGDYVGQDDDA